MIKYYLNSVPFNKIHVYSLLYKSVNEKNDLSAPHSFNRSLNCLNIQSILQSRLLYNLFQFSILKHLSQLNKLSLKQFRLIPETHSLP